MENAQILQNCQVLWKVQIFSSDSKEEADAENA